MSTLQTDSRFYGPELLQVADAVAREKGLEKDKILEAMEGAIQKAARSKYGTENDIRVRVDRRTGAVSINKYVTVVDLVEDNATQVDLNEARKLDPAAEVGFEFITELPPVDFGRVAAQVGRQIILQKIRDAERDKQYDEFKSRVGEIISGIVKRSEFGGITVDIGRTEAIIRKDQIIPKENFRMGDRVRAYIEDVRREPRGPQIFLSRTHPQFLAQLFKLEVPEIYDGVIEVKSVARDPGSRAKVAVYTADQSIDPIGACVGIRGSRVQAVIQELQGEKIDIVLWSDDPATFVVNALSPAEVSKVVIDEDTHKFEVLAPDNQLSLAIGRRGQNVRLASALTGWNVSVVSESKAMEKSNQEYHARSQIFMDVLDCDEVIAHLLVTEGFSQIEELAQISKEDLASIDGFDDALSEELISRAKNYLERQEKQAREEIKKMKIDKRLVALGVFPSATLLRLAEHGIVKLDDLADLSRDELMEILPELSKDAADSIVMKAREHWFA